MDREQLEKEKLTSSKQLDWIQAKVIGNLCNCNWFESGGANGLEQSDIRIPD